MTKGQAGGSALFAQEVAMRDGQCPKCGSSDIRAIPGEENVDPHRLPIGMLDTAGLDHYVCVYCGYVEIYIAGVQYLQRIAAKFPRVEKSEQPQDKKDHGL
jgi:predicted nucleic-acid-binding Zn-ribbon protein